MAHQFFNVEEVAAYLHLTPEDVLQRVKRREIPHEKRGPRVVFSQTEIDEWVARRILSLPPGRLAEYHRKSTRDTREILPHQALLPDMLLPQFIAPAMTARTKASVLRELVALAELTGRLNDPKGLHASLEAREELCSTGMPGGFALPHPRSHEPYVLESSFIVVGRSIQEIHFGAPDGEPTRLFFLICCQDERLHLHTLARLCLIAQKTDLLARLQSAPDAATIFDILVAAEQEVLNELPPG